MNDYDNNEWDTFATSDCDTHGETMATECNTCGMDTCTICTICEWCETTTNITTMKAGTN